MVFSHPPIGTIGLTEEEAVKEHGQDKLKIYKSTFVNLFYGPWQMEPSDKPKTAMKLICLGPEERVRIKHKRTRRLFCLVSFVSFSIHKCHYFYLLYTCVRACVRACVHCYV